MTKLQTYTRSSSFGIGMHLGNLPNLLQDHFIFVVSQFLFMPWNHAQKLAASKASSDAGDLCTPSITIAAANNFESCMVEYLREQVQEPLIVKFT